MTAPESTRHRQGLLVSAGAFVVAVAALALSSSAAASDISLVTGSAASTGDGRVIVNARTTGPATAFGYSWAPATGFLQARETSWGDLRGTVTCIGWDVSTRVVLSGTLDQPVTVGGYMYPNFTFMILGGSQPMQWLLVDNLADGNLEPCGVSLLFGVGPWDPWIDRTPFLTEAGNFVIR